MSQSPCIMLQGTGSHVGKSVLAAALCRIFLQDGLKVAPFKSQNMALNSYVTADGGEMGRAQVVQAEAAGLAPSVLMNPVLLKPTGQATSQVIVMGKPVGNMSAKEYHEKYNIQVLQTVENALKQLRDQFEVIVIEGAGSPAEVNLQATEIVNMRIARMADCPVLLVADIDKGGALASVVGTLELLDKSDRERVKGVIINKFRGDVGLFMPAVKFLEEKTGIPVVGIIPYYTDIRIQEEDTISEAHYKSNTYIQRGKSDGESKNDEENKINVTVIKIPHISNFTDFDPLENEPDVIIEYVDRADELETPNLIILPGSKNTIHDLIFLDQSGLKDKILELAAKGTPIIGICGGYQMLGKKLRDPFHTESEVETVEGFGLLDVVTTFEPEKITTQVSARVIGQSGLLHSLTGNRVTGYEIHMGRSVLGNEALPAFEIYQRSGQGTSFSDGALHPEGMIFGTYIHGVFDNDDFRRNIINKLRKMNGWEPLCEYQSISARVKNNEEINRLANLVRNHLDIQKIYDLLAIKPDSPTVLEEGR